jgi:hypothetical protein
MSASAFPENPACRPGIPLTPELHARPKCGFSTDT